VGVPPSSQVHEPPGRQAQRAAGARTTSHRRLGNSLASALRAPGARNAVNRLLIAKSAAVRFPVAMAAHLPLTIF
jgi:hypothetical protein